MRRLFFRASNLFSAISNPKPKDSFEKILGFGGFSDFKKIKIATSAGGDGCITFDKSRHCDYGPPSGGSGGTAGSIYITACKNEHSLHAVKSSYRTHPGCKGGGKFMSGKNAEDVEIRVPVGTTVKSLSTFQMNRDRPPILDGRQLEVESKEYHELLEIVHQHYLFKDGYIPGPDRVLMLLERILQKNPTREIEPVEADLLNDGDRILLLRGGKGGQGNPHFVTPVIQGPGMAERGSPGASMLVELELKTIADAGLVGLPNAGKSTLLKAVSNAHPRIAPYPFTTLNPYVGTIDYADAWTMTLADIPGIIQGASENRGLGHRFLRHIERTKMLVYVIDLSGPEPWNDLLVLQQELEAYKPGLTKRMSIIAANKADIESARGNYEILTTKTSIPIVPLSAKDQGNISKLTTMMRNMHAYSHGSLDWVMGIFMDRVNKLGIKGNHCEPIFKMYPQMNSYQMYDTVLPLLYAQMARSAMPMARMMPSMIPSMYSMHSMQPMVMGTPLHSHTIQPCGNFNCCHSMSGMMPGSMPGMMGMC